MAVAELTALDLEHPLRPVVSVWREKVRLAKRDKKEKFGVFADEAMAFYTGPSPEARDDEVWKRFMAPPPMQGGEYTPPEAHFHFIIAKVAELVQIFGPVLYHRNPVRTVEPRPTIQIPQDAIIDPQLQQQLQMLDQQMQQNPAIQQDPMFVMQYQQIQALMQQATNLYNEMVMSQQKVHSRAKARAIVMEKLLNYLPNENDLKTHSRRAINEALIKGAGCLKTESYQRKDGTTLVRSVYLSVDDWYFDPDARDREDIWWMAEECLHPVWDVAEEYGVDEDYLRRHCALTSSNSLAESRNETSEVDMDVPTTGKTNDLLRYWKIYSRMGVGDRLKGVAAEYRDTLKSLGRNVYIVVAEGVPFPLNCPSDAFKAAIEDEEQWEGIVERFQWPIPFWVDDEWPISELVFHEIPNCAWPMSHIRPALCHLKFLNWAMSYLGDKVAQTNRTIFAMKKGANEETKRLLESGPPVTVLELSEFEGQKLSDVFQAVPIGGDHKSMWEMVQAEQINFDKSSGLTEMMYAIPGGIRSATEAQIKENARNVRPDDMANKVEDWMSTVARKEALAAALEMGPQDIAKILGPGAAKLWEMFVASEDAADLALELDYRIEAGTAKKPNKETQQFQIQQAISNLGPTLQMLVQQGTVGPWNELMKRFMESLDYHDFEGILVPQPQPNPVAQQMEQLQVQQAAADVQKTQAEAEAKRAQAATEGQDAGIKMQAEQMKLGLEQQKAQMDMAAKQADIQFEREKHSNEMQMMERKALLELDIDQRKASQELQQDAAMFTLDARQRQAEMAMNVQASKQKMETDAAVGEQKVAQAKQMAKAKPKPTKPSK